MRFRNRKLFAAVFLLLFSIQTFYPCAVFALTSGPAQPEMQNFTPAGTSDMVDLFTGDFKENIPLMDVGGYPINLSYHSGTNMEEEASWVGTGWSLNPGSVNRTLRGLPDDFDGDQITKTSYRKPFKKAGGRVLVKPTIFGFDGIINSPSFSLDVYKDNYYGFGATFGASVSFNLGQANNTSFTAGLDFSSDSRDGLTVTPSFDIAKTYTGDWNDQMTTSLSGSLPYNTRAGLKSWSLNASFDVKRESFGKMLDVGSTSIGSYTHYFGQTYTPSLNTNSRSNSYTLSVDFGPYIFGGYVGIGGAGYIYNEGNTESVTKASAYGYLNYLHGRGNDGCLLDFNREKDGIYIPSAPSISTPVATQDMFSVTGQAGSAQFRPYCAGNYLVFDKKYSNVSNSYGAKVTVGGGWIWQLGGRLDYTHAKAETKKWVSGNNYLGVAEFTPDNSKPTEEPVYFKQVGEPVAADQDFMNTVGNTEAEAVKVHTPTGNSGTADAAFRNRSNGSLNLGTIKRTQRDKRNFTFGYLTAKMASYYNHALDRMIPSYTGSIASDYGGIVQYSRMDATHAAHHMSEIKVTDNEGKRMVYGIPVYNLSHQEFSFAYNPNNIADKATAKRTGLITYSGSDINLQNPGSYNSNGRDGFVQKQVTPPYAASFLLTGVLSPDYVDLTGNGITDDDLGTAYKFNYKKMGYNYRWRAPYGRMQANYNEGLLSDRKDDQGNIVYGEKELWYMRAVESKTMIAIFETSSREDGLGVTDEDGGRNTSARVLKLDAIKLYSKADWIKNGVNATPIKVAHFEYDYSLYPNVPNNSGAVVTNPYVSGNTQDINSQHGKLTLRKVYFTFGASNRGTTNPYAFDYDMRPVNPVGTPVAGLPVPSYGSDVAERNDWYAERQGDRWGTYKQSWYNNTVPGSVDGYLNNSEYPYSLQKNRPPAGVSATDWIDFIDRLVSKWQLNKITTPSGSVISVTYESDDYAYVQDKEAMQMYRIKGVENDGQQASGLVKSQYLDIELPVPLTGSSTADQLSDFTRKYLDGTNVVYFKVNTNLKGNLSNADKVNKTFNDYVSGYAEIDPTKTVITNTQNIKLFLNKISGYSPIAKTAWQKVKTDLPQYAYNGYDNSDLSGGDFAIVMEAIYWTFVNFRELWHNFDVIANNQGLADNIDLTHSFVRLKSPTATVDFGDGKRIVSKTGGGSRVRKIEINDQWHEMAGGDTKSANYGQEYTYTTTDKWGNSISSGVASYEPQGGNEENPFHQPIKYTEKVHWGIDKYHVIEKPYCESYFPAPGVGYSKVKTTSYGDDNARETGYVINEFYTAKDFPTLVDNLQLDNPSRQYLLPLLLFSMAEYTQATSQGFTIELNDMHGKPKAVRVVDKAGREISLTEYFYKVTDQNAEQKNLDNTNMPVLQSDLSVGTATLATDMDLVTDARQSKSENIGTSVGIYPGGFMIPIPPPFGPIYIPTFGVVPFVTYTNKSYFSTATVKVISRYGIVTKVKTTKNGASLTTENTLWDKETGEVLLTKTQNEFNDYTYAFHYPAWMSYEGMGSAYKNIGAVFNNFVTDANGYLQGWANPGLYFFPGDELVSANGDTKGWVMLAPDGSFRFIDNAGNFITTSGAYYLLRSGRRNLLTSSVGTVVTMKDPVVNGKLSPDVSRLVLDAKSVVFREKWAQPRYCKCPPGYGLSADGNSCVIEVPATSDGQCSTVCIGANQPYTSLGSVIYSSYNVNGSGTVQYAMNGTSWGVPSIDNYLWREDCSAYTRTALSEPLWAAGPFINPRSMATALPADTIIPLASASAAVATPAVSLPPGCSRAAAPRDFGCGPLTRSGIWICSGTDANGHWLPMNSDITFSAQLTVPHDGLYYIGLSGDNTIRFTYDGTTIINYTSEDSYQSWRIYPLNMVTGSHTITIGGRNTGGPAALGCEIYDNTAYEIAHASYLTRNPRPAGGDNMAHLIFSSNDLLGLDARIDNKSCPIGYSLTPGASGITCRQTIAVNNVVNPYYADMLGNWHPETNFVYTVSRVQNQGVAAQNGGTDIRNSGYYNSFTPFWQILQPGGSLQNNSSVDNRWVWSNTTIHTDQKGNEVENMDPLGRFGSALFGYQQSLATAVAANARQNEVAFDGFEDYNFSLATTDSGACRTVRHLDLGFFNPGTGVWTSGSSIISNEKSHSGSWSVKLNSTLSVVKPLGTASPAWPLLGNDNTGRYLRLDNEMGVGFAPIAGKKYLVSLWVNEDANDLPTTNTVQHLTINVNGTPITTTATPVAVVEGWKRIEASFTVSSGFQLDIVPGGANVFIDDIRILPFDGQLATYVYDPVTLRLVAQLDENNFATFYEYDEEGTPVRVKKETERGIMTLKENRQSFIKH